MEVFKLFEGAFLDYYMYKIQAVILGKLGIAQCMNTSIARMGLNKLDIAQCMNTSMGGDGLEQAGYSSMCEHINGWGWA